MTSRVSACIVAFLLLASVMVPALVAAQTSQTTIANLQYPSQTVLQNGLAQAAVTFTVGFSGLPSGNRLVFGVLYEGTSNFVTGSATSTPDSCALVTGEYANSAGCVISPPSGSGTESASFTLTFNSTQQYTLMAFAGIADSSNHAIKGAMSSQSFAVSVVANTQLFTSSVAQTVPPNAQTGSVNQQTSSMDFAVGLAIIALPFIAVIGLIVYVVRRRKGKRMGGTATEGLASKTAPAPVSIAEGTKFCADCGARMPLTASFCESCGSKQN